MQYPLPLPSADMIYSFLLGHQPEISAAEIKAVFQHKNIKTSSSRAKPREKQKNNQYLLVDFDEEINAEEIIRQLGGTIKIAKDTKYEKYEITKYLQENNQNGKIEFSLNDPKLAIEVKKTLKNAGRSARYIEPKNTATILHNNLIGEKTDLTIIDGGIFATVAIQPIEELSERDYGRPRSDDKSGMLPPKLAKIMINLSVETLHTTSLQHIVILDPFCGSGTILTEAMAMGYKNLIGSDISPQAVENTKQNIDWIVQTYKLQAISYKLYNADAQNLDTKIKPGSIDAIITEPHLGKPLHGNESKQYLQKQTQELSQLYINSFKSFHKILKPNGVAVFIIPRFMHNDDCICVNCTEEIKKTGFEILPFDKQLNLLYHRPKQRLAREIWRFRKN